jgi:hypothetical protein
MDFVWEEIKDISLNPQKTCGFAPYLMFIIEDVTGRNFLKEGKHMPFSSNPTKKPLIPPAEVSSPLREDPTPAVAESVRPVGVNNGSLLVNSKKNPPPLSRRCLGFYLICVSFTIPQRLGFMRREKPTKSFKRIWRSIKHSIPTRPLPLWAPKVGRATLLLHSSKYMLVMKALIHLSRLLLILALVTWCLTLSLVVTLVSKVPHLMHLLLHLL